MTRLIFLWLVDVSDVRYLLLSKVIQGLFPFLREG